MSTFQKAKRFLEPVFDNKILAFRAILNTSIFGFFGLFNVYMIKTIIDIIELGDYKKLMNSIVFYLIVIVFYQIIIFLIIKRGYLHYGVLKTLNQKYLSQYIRLDNTSVEKYGTGRMISIIEGGIFVWKDMIAQIFMTLPEFIVSFVYATIIIGQISWIYAILFIIILLIVQSLVLFIAKFAHKYRKKRYELEGEYKRSFVRLLMSKFEILQSDKQQNEINILNNNIDQSRKIDQAKHTYEHISFNMPDQMILLMKIFVFFFIGSMVIQGQQSIANLMLFVSLLAYMDSNIKSSLAVIKGIVKHYASLERLWNLFDEIPEIKNYDSGKQFIFKNGNIQIENIYFSYSDKEKNYVIKDLSFEIEGGKQTAFVGPSGGGKSTILKMIAGYIKPDRGEICIDGQAMSKCSLKSYYRNIGYLTQDPNVFDGTIRENLMYGTSQVEEKELIKSIKMAKCEFIYDLPHGIDTEIGERGIRLSGGQKQRIAIAKIFIKNPKIILLDEPTSALDSISEESIRKAMENLFKGRTVIIIAHRLQTVKKSDDIILIDKGQIIERGKHNELIAKKGKYYQMLELQSEF